MTTTLFSNLQNVITVSPKNGDFTTLDAAIASVASKASEKNPFLIVIGPGVYTIGSTLKMVPYVNIKGSGREITILEGAIGDSAYSAAGAILTMSNYCQVSNLTIKNSGNNQPYSIGVYSSQSISSQLKDVSVSAKSDKDSVCAVYCDSTSLLISNSGVSASGPLNSPTSTTKTFGILAEGTSAPTVENVLLSGNGGAYAHGVYHSGGNNLDINNSFITSESATHKNYCIYVDSGFVVVRNSNIMSPYSSPVPSNSRYAVYVNNASYATKFFSCVVSGPVGGPGDADFYASFNSAGYPP